MDLRYRNFAEQGEIDGVKFYHYLTFKEYQYDGPFVVHTVEFEQDLYLISYIHYDTIENWWIIAWNNGISDPFCIEPGTTLEIPTDLDDIQSMLEGL